MDKFACFYKSLDTSGIVLTASPESSNAAPSVTSALGARYVRRGDSRDVAELHSDATFSLTQQGMKVEGTYRVDGDAVMLSAPQIRGGQRGRLSGTTSLDPQGNVWERQANEQMSSTPIPVEQVIPIVAATLLHDVIVRTVKSSRLAFTLTPDVLVQLKNGGVSDAVIRAITP